MKSIKEKAEEHLNSVYAGYDDVLKKLVKEGYVSGANYVLEKIEDIIRYDKDPHVIEALKERIWRLKNDDRRAEA